LKGMKVSVKITPEQVQHIARLARLAVPGDQEDKLVEELSDILEYMEHLQELDTSAVEPLAHVVEIRNALRPDTVGPTLERESALANAPDRTGECFRVPGAVDKDIDEESGVDSSEVSEP